MEEIIKRFATRLAALREERGLTLQELHETLDIGMSTLSQYENLQREPKLINLLKLSRFFDVSVDYLTGNSNVRK